MGAYMYPIKIKREPQKISYSKQIELKNEGVLTLAELREYVTEDEEFSINEKENSIYGNEYILSVWGKRMETDDEVKNRVAKEESYMKNYTEFHEKLKSKL
jgi:hypothetical protein